MSKTVGIVSLGCAKNLVDTEIALGYLHEANYSIVTDPKSAEVLIVNTCGFIEPAKEESINCILEMAEYKNNGLCCCLIVMGCLSARYKEELWNAIPEIDALLGISEMARIPEIIPKILSGQRVYCIDDQYFSYDDPQIPRLISTGRHSSYLKIAEGCNHRCAFCIIPKIRGPYRSRKPETIIAEAEKLAASGVKELNVIAQDTTKYGTDLAYDYSLVDLLTELVKIDIPWIRILYTYPAFFSDEIINLMAQHDNLISYIDLPLQHASASVLRRMKRPGSYDSNLALIKRIRSRIPSAAVRSSFIVGFPGETEADFTQLLEFLAEAKLQHCGIFQFSAEEDTAAYSMPNQISDEIKAKRYDQAMLLQQQISLAHQQKLIGTNLEVLIEGHSDESELVLVGRHRHQALDVDGLVYMGNRHANIGDLVSVKIIQAHPYDLVGEIIEGDVT